jgi:hypothetical protein
MEADVIGEPVATSGYLSRPLRELNHVRAARILRRVIKLSQKYAGQGNRARSRYWWKVAEWVAGRCGGCSGASWSSDYSCIVLDGPGGFVARSPLPMRTDVAAAMRLVAGARGSIYRADNAGSMMCGYLIAQASSALEDAAEMLPDGLAGQALALAARCDAALETAGFPYTDGLYDAAEALLSSVKALVEAEAGGRRAA